MAAGERARAGLDLDGGAHAWFAPLPRPPYNGGKSARRGRVLRQHRRLPNERLKLGLPVVSSSTTSSGNVTMPALARREARK